MLRLSAATISFSLFAALSPAWALTDGVPKFDVSRSCREAEAFADEGTHLAYKGCMQDEQDALKQLQKKWSSFKAADRDTCIAQGISPLPSYVEILTCIEMYDSASIMYKPGPSPGASNVPTPTVNNPSTSGATAK